MSQIPTSPTLSTDSGIVHSAKQFSDNLTLDLTDDEIKRALEYIVTISKKWQRRFRVKFNNIAEYRHLSESQVVEMAAELIDEFEKELHHTLAEKLELVVTVDMAPVFNGEPPVVELVGHLDTSSAAHYGLDHERKEWEVKKSKERSEDFYGQKSATNTHKKRQESIKHNKKTNPDT